MQLEGPQPDGSSRFRPDNVQVGVDRGRLHLGEHLSGVLTGTASRSEAGRWIATNSSTTVIDLAVVHAQWRASWSEQRDELAAAHASYRLEGYRIDAALERARDRLPTPGAPVAAALVAYQPAPAAPEPAPAEPVPEATLPTDDPPPVDWAHPPDPTTHMRAKLQTLIATIDAMEPEPLPEGLLLADAWDAHASLLRARKAADELPIADIELLEQRVNAARAAIERSARRVTDVARGHIEHCHRAVVEAEAALFEAKRRQRSAALARYEAAVADELVALSNAGVESYASFLFEITGGGATTDLAARLAAETELAEARTDLDVARQVPSVPTHAELEAREMQMRARATELLGHTPGADPPSELRALRVDAVGSEETIIEIGEVLSHGGIPVTGDVVECARAVLVAPPATVRLPAPPARPPVPDDEGPSAPPRRAELEALPAWATPPGVTPATVQAPTARPPTASVPPAGTVDPARWREIADLEEQRSAHNRKVRELETDLARIDRMRESGAARLGGSDLVRALDFLLAAYRSGKLLDGQGPLILVAVLDGLTVADREAALNVFARASDVQTVVVTDDPEVMQSLSREGGMLVRWPEPLVTLVEEPDTERRTAPTRGA